MSLELSLADFLGDLFSALGGEDLLEISGSAYVRNSFEPGTSPYPATDIGRRRRRRRGNTVVCPYNFPKCYHSAECVIESCWDGCSSWDRDVNYLSRDSTGHCGYDYAGAS